ncbi:MAG: glycerate kinase [Elusimicrobia bacterium]|nr:glycerate kinase [Candidatus Obscuribacterium magneticum]
MRKPLILISPTAFKGTLSPWEAAKVVAGEIEKLKIPCRLKILPLADGGDGTLEVLMRALGGRIQKSRVQGPLGGRVRASWGILKNGAAVIEMARASGLALVKGENRILEATSFGTGQLMKEALGKGCRRFIVGVGGTATGEGGAGALEALGLRYVDRQGRALSARPVDLIRLHRIDWAGFDKRLRKARIYVVCDVRNPLLGPRGSARTFGPQKGATPAQVLFLEKVLRRWSRFARVDAKAWPGAGAAGALAFGLAGFCGATLVKGTPFVMDILKWSAQASKADVIVTGEGRLDKTSFGGKVVDFICRRRKGARLFVLCGLSDLPEKGLRGRGIEKVYMMGPSGLHQPRRALALVTRQLFEKNGLEKHEYH